MSRFVLRLMRPSRVKIDLLLVAGLHAFQKLVGCAVLALLARHFDPSSMGQLFFAMALAVLLTMPTELGTHRYLTRAIAADPANAGRHLGAVLSLRLPLLVVSYALLGAVAWAVAPGIAPLLMLASLYAFLDSFYFSLSFAFTAQRRVAYHVAMYSFGQVLLAGMVGAAVLAGGGIALALSGYVASQLVLVAVAVALARWWVGPIPIRFDPTGLRRLARDTTPFFVLVFLDLLLFKIDTVMIWFLQTPVEVALYESAYKFLEVSRSVVRPLGLIFLPVCVQIATRADWPEFRTLTTRLVSAATSLGAVTAALVILAGGSALPWVWGDAYTDAIPVLRVLFLSVPAVFVAFVSQILVTALRLERSAIQGMALAVVLNVALNAAVIPRWGAIGAAWTTLASELLIAALMLRLVARGIRQRLSAGPRVADLEPAESDREQVILR